MNEAQLRIIMFSTANFLLVVTRSTIPCSYTGKPQKWEYSLFTPARAHLAFKMYNNACNQPEHYESYILNVAVPAFLAERVPYGDLATEFFLQFDRTRNCTAKVVMEI